MLIAVYYSQDYYFNKYILIKSQITLPYYCVPLIKGYAFNVTWLDQKVGRGEDVHKPFLEVLGLIAAPRQQHNTTSKAKRVEKIKLAQRDGGGLT